MSNWEDIEITNTSDEEKNLKDKDTQRMILIPRRKEIKYL